MGLNKKGIYFASLSIVLVFILVFGNGFIKNQQIIENGINDLGKVSVSVIKTNLEGEELRFFIQDSAEVAKEMALRSLKLNGGVYDKNECETNGDYVVLETCGGVSVEESFLDYFNESFDFVLKNYDESFSSEDFEFSFNEGILTVSGSKKLFLGINSKIAKNELDKVLDHDGILEAVRKYSNEYGVDEDIIKAIIVQESGGKIGAVSVVGAKGLMQIYEAAHPQFFDDNGCNAADSVDCNIMAGTNILSGYIEVSREDYENRVKKFCSDSVVLRKFLSYNKVERGLRLYNGPGCKCSTCDDDYVENVLNRFEKGSVENVGNLIVNLDTGNDVEYDFDLLKDVLAKSGVIKDCIGDGGFVEACASAHTDFNHIFTTRQVNEGLVFEVREAKFDEEGNNVGDVIKFA